MKREIERKIASMVDPEELGKLYEEGFSISLERYQSIYGVSARKLEKLARSERKREIGRIIRDKLILFADMDVPQILEIRSPPCGEPESLREFLSIAKEAISEAQKTSDLTFVPFAIAQDNVWYPANINVHIKIPTPDDLRLLGYEIEEWRYREIPLQMANALRNYYSILA